jgi:hypothetical protein
VFHKQTSARADGGRSKTVYPRQCRPGVDLRRRGVDEQGRRRRARGREGSHTDAVARWNTLFGWGGGRGERERSVGGFRLEAGAGLRPVRCLVAAERAQGASTRRAAASRGWRAEGGRDI